MFYLILILNLIVSWWNCYAVGGIWNESKAIGGFSRVLAWSAAIQSAIGFSMVIGFVVGGLMHVTGHLPEKTANVAMSMWYLAVVVPAIGSGLVITIHSWIVACRERSLMNVGSAALNTAIQASNMYSSIDGISHAFNAIWDAFSSDDAEDLGSLVGVALAIAAFALGSGIVLTYVLIRRYANRLNNFEA